MERGLADGVGVADELSGVGVVPLDVGEQLLHDGQVAPTARLVQRGLAALGRRIDALKARQLSSFNMRLTCQT